MSLSVFRWVGGTAGEADPAPDSGARPAGLPFLGPPWAPCAASSVGQRIPAAHCNWSVASLHHLFFGAKLGSTCRGADLLESLANPAVLQAPSRGLLPPSRERQRIWEWRPEHRWVFWQSSRGVFSLPAWFLSASPRLCPALELLKNAIGKAGYTDKVVIGMDVAASEFYRSGKYDLDFKSPDDPSRYISPDQLADLYKSFIRDYPGECSGSAGRRRAASPSVTVTPAPEQRQSWSCWARTGALRTRTAGAPLGPGTPGGWGKQGTSRLGLA